MGTNGSAKRILLIEDDRFLRRACETGLRQRGYAVVTAADGEEGLRAARSEPPDLILLDLLMPKMSGLEVLRSLRADAATQHIPVLVLSNSSHQRHVSEVVRLNAEYFVKANLSLQELGRRVAEILAGEGSPSAVLGVGVKGEPGRANAPCPAIETSGHGRHGDAAR